MIGQVILLARLYWRPFSAMSALLDEGNWVFGAALVVLLSGVLQYTLVTKQQDAIREMAPTAEVSTPQADVPGILALRLFTANSFSVFTSLLGLMVVFVPGKKSAV